MLMGLSEQNISRPLGIVKGVVCGVQHFDTATFLTNRDELR